MRHAVAQETHKKKVFIMVTNLSSCPPGEGIEALNRLPGLAEPLLDVDLEQELQELRKRTPGSGKREGVPRPLRNTRISELF